MMSKHVVAGLFAALALIALPGAPAAAYVDVLDAAPQKSALAEQRILNGAAVAGARVVVVGQRGHILYSDDAGKSWTQASVPVSVDLCAVHFPTANKGWAVGHSGVVLATSDGGMTWTRQFDGRAAAAAMVGHYAGAAAGSLAPDALAALRDEAKRFEDDGPDKAFLDVWFENENTGYIVGQFNMIFRTDNGGRTWVPWFDRTDNPRRFHLYAIRRIGNDLYAAGEQGTVLKLDAKVQRFTALAMPYEGTFFGIAGKPGSVLVFGLRGNAYRSTDGGSSWHKIDIRVPVGLTAGTTTADGRLVLMSQAGHALVSSDSGATFTPLALERAAPAGAVVTIGGRIVVAGPRGVHASALP